VEQGGHRFLGGRVSVPLTDGGATAAGVWDAVRTRHLAPAALRVVPRVPFDVDAAARPARLETPPLLRAALRVGAHVCGPPAHDAGLGTVDFYVLLRMVDVPQWLRRRPAATA
jgi:putative hemolysin